MFSQPDPYLAARHKYFDEATCPACNLLPLGALSHAKETASGPAPATIRLHDLDYSALERAAPKCDFAQLLAHLRDHWTSDQSEVPVQYDGVTYRALCGRSEWRIRYTDQTYLTILTDWDGILAERVDQWKTSKDPLSPQCVRLMRHWTTECQNKHSECFNHPQELPTRVIDVQSATLKLIDPSPSGAHDYVALSHCWGTCRAFLTTRENLEERKKGFDINELPATFQDAVKVTRQLGISFLWIDSICILQGDKDDWEIEGSKMADVYANATLTIAATNASDDAEGFLKARNIAPILDINIIFSSNDSNVQEEKYTCIYTRLPTQTKLIYEPLDGRAWCLQERYLSPRLLFFDTDSLRWECLGGDWFEDGRGLMNKRMMLADVLPECKNAGSFSWVRWYRMVELYSTRGISYPGDKLPALSALASRAAQHSGDKYLAGLWKSDLLQGMFWYRQVRHQFRDREPKAPFMDTTQAQQQQQQQQQHQQQYLAPSWSWASFRGAIHFEATQPSELKPQLLQGISVLSARVSVPGKNKFGQVESGSVKLRSPLLTFESDQGCDVPVRGAWEHNVIWCVEFEEWDIATRSTFDYPEQQTSTPIKGVPVYYEDEKEEIRFDKMNMAEDREEWIKASGVLLRQHESSERVYQRVGLFTISLISLESFSSVLGELDSVEIEIV